MGKIGLTKEGTLQNLMRNPQQMMSKVQNMMDPRILRQLGGAGNMVNLIKEVRTTRLLSFLRPGSLCSVLRFSFLYVFSLSTASLLNSFYSCDLSIAFRTSFPWLVYAH